MVIRAIGGMVTYRQAVPQYSAGSLADALLLDHPSGRQRRQLDPILPRHEERRWLVADETQTVILVV